MLASPRLELETFSVLDWRDNRLHHDTPVVEKPRLQSQLNGREFFIGFNVLPYKVGAKKYKKPISIDVGVAQTRTGDLQCVRLTW